LAVAPIVGEPVHADTAHMTKTNVEQTTNEWRQIQAEKPAARTCLAYLYDRVSRELSVLDNLLRMGVHHIPGEEAEVRFLWGHRKHLLGELRS